MVEDGEDMNEMSLAGMIARWAHRHKEEGEQNPNEWEAVDGGSDQREAAVALGEMRALLAGAVEALESGAHDDEGEAGLEDLSGIASTGDVLDRLRAAMNARHAGCSASCLHASALYCTVLATGGAGVYAFVDTAALIIALGTVKRAFASANSINAGATSSAAGKRARVEKGGQQEAEDPFASETRGAEDASDLDASLATSMGLHCLESMKVFFGRFSTEHKPEFLKAAAGIIAEVAPLEFVALSNAEASDAKNSKKRKNKDGGGTGVGGEGSSMRLTSLSALEQMVSSVHGSVVDSGAVVLRSLAMNAILSPSGIAGSMQLFRKECLQLVDKLVETHGVLVDPAVAALMRHLCLCSPERAEERMQILVGVGSMFQLLSDAEQVSFARFNYRLSKTKKPKHRLVAVDMASLLIRQLKNDDGPPAKADGDAHGPAAEKGDAVVASIDMDDPFNEFCVLGIGLMVQRSSDRVNQIRGRALSHLADALSMCATVPAMRPIMEYVCVAPILQDDRCPATTPRIRFELPTEDAEDAEDDGEEEQDMRTAVKSTIGPGATPLEALAPAEDLFEILCRRCKDESAVVRKASILALERLLISQLPHENGQNAGVEAIAIGCLDGLVTVRRQALNSLGALLDELPLDRSIVRVWIRMVLPLASDSETSVSDRVAKWVKELLLDPLCDAQSKSEHVACAYAMLEEIYAAPAAHLMLETSVERGAKQNPPLFDASMTASVQKLICKAEGEPPKGLWLMCALLGSACPKGLKWRSLFEQWKNLDASADSDRDDDMRFALSCIASAAKNFDRTAAMEIILKLNRKLSALKLSPALVAANVKAFYSLSEHFADNDGVCPSSGFNAATATIFSNAAQFFSDVMAKLRSGGGSYKMDATAASAVLVTVSEMALYSKARAPEGLVTMVQALLADESLGGRDGVPSVVQAHAWVALGKLCFVDAALAKKCLPLFVKQLGLSRNAAVRNNIVIVLSDLCTKYTSLVDAYIGKIAAALADDCEVVRRQTLVLLSSLLHNDYVKWRGPLLHRILLCLVDDSSLVREIADSTFSCGRSSASATNLAYNNFMESLMVLNGRWSETRGAASEGILPDDEISQNCTLVGDENRVKRISIYSALLARMTPEQRIATSARVCSDLLNEFSENGRFSVGADADLLFDGLAILQLPEAKPMPSSSSKSSDDSVALEMETSSSASAVAAAKRRVLAEVTRRTLIEAIVPSLVHLRNDLLKARSPFVADVMAALCAQLANRQKDLAAAFASEPQLLKEIQFDLREMERHNAKFVKTPGSSRVPALKNQLASTGKKAGPSTSAHKNAPAGTPAAREQTPADNTPYGIVTAPGQQSTPSSAARKMKRLSLHGVCPATTPAAALVLASPPYSSALASAGRGRTVHTPSTSQLKVPMLKSKIVIDDADQENDEAYANSSPVKVNLGKTMEGISSQGLATGA